MFIDSKVIVGQFWKSIVAFKEGKVYKDTKIETQTLFVNQIYLSFALIQAKVSNSKFLQNNSAPSQLRSEMNPFLRELMVGLSFIICIYK
jgi:hypothetical protein